MTYNHGISILESPTQASQPLQSLSAVQVVVGTAPVNLLSNPAGAVNKPLLVNTYEEAVAAAGYSDDWDNYTLCQAIDASFKQFGVAPLILINVLDPATHKTAVAEQTVNISNGTAKVNTLGILLDDAFIVKDSTGTTTYVKGTDYTVTFDDDGYPVITRIASGTISAEATQLKVTCNKINPSMVTTSDVVGSYDAVTNTYKGINCITEIYPMFNLIPGLLIAPGWSQNKDVAAALDEISSLINGSFNAMDIVDLDCDTTKIYSNVPAWKNTNGYTGKRQLALWPKVKIDDKVYWYSAVMAALIAYIDTQNNGVPFKSPSNKKLPIEAAVLEDGSEVFLDQLQANTLNASGIVTAINMAGWRTWGNNTAAYPEDIDPKDRFIAIRRVFDWWGNNFIVDFFDKVDDPTNYRLIESVIDEENIKANGYQAAGQIAGAKISFNQTDNPVSNIQNGQIKFVQSIGAFPPAENIINELQFDPTMVASSLSGGEQ